MFVILSLLDWKYCPLAQVSLETVMCFGSSAKMYLCCSEFLVGGFVGFVWLGVFWGGRFVFGFSFTFWFYFQPLFPLPVLGPFEMFQGCELPRTAILLVEFVSLFHFHEQRRAQAPGCWSLPAPGASGFCSTTGEMLHPQHFHLRSVQVLLLLVSIFQLISLKRCYSLLMWPCRSELPGSFPLSDWWILDSDAFQVRACWSPLASSRQHPQRG